MRGFKGRLLPAGLLPAGVLLSGLLLSGCASNPQLWTYNQSGVRYQLVQIKGQDYFLDQTSGRLYLVEKAADGQLRLDHLAGEIGHAR